MTAAFVAWRGPDLIALAAMFGVGVWVGRRSPRRTRKDTHA